MRCVRRPSLSPSEEFLAESDGNTRLALVLLALPDEKPRAWLCQCRKRMAVERVKARLKDHSLLDNLTVRGIRRVRVHTGLSLLVMLAGDLGLPRLLGGPVARCEAPQWRLTVARRRLRPPAVAP